MEKLAWDKINPVYNEIDETFYKGLAQKAHRSRHNCAFTLPDAAHFIEEAAKEGILEIKGYSLVGGIRASLYNGVSLASAQHLASFLSHYRSRFG